MGDVIVSTHRFNNGLNPARLTEFRLKDARQRRDDAIAKAHDQYAHEVAMLRSSHDRLTTEALTRGDRASWWPWPWLAGIHTKHAPIAPTLEAPFDHAFSRAVVPDGDVFDALAYLQRCVATERA